MTESGVDTVSGVRVMGWCGGEEGEGLQRLGTGIWCMPGRNDGFERVLRYGAAVRIGATSGTIFKRQAQ